VFYDQSKGIVNNSILLYENKPHYLYRFVNQFYGIDGHLQQKGSMLSIG